MSVITPAWIREAAGAPGEPVPLDSRREAEFRAALTRYVADYRECHVREPGAERPPAFVLAVRPRGRRPA